MRRLAESWFGICLGKEAGNLEGRGKSKNGHCQRVNRTGFPNSAAEKGCDIARRLF